VRLAIRVRHNYDAGARRVASLNPRLKVALLEGTTRATSVLANAVVRSVIDRTTMNAGIAAAITDSEVVLGRGKVSFKPPPPGGWEIRPKNKKALFWKGMIPKGGGKPHPVARVQHPGSRPYVLIGRAAVSSEALIRQQWDDAVGEVL
jgi:hypothetical protein